MAITVNGTLLKEATLGTSLVTKAAVEQAFADLGVVLKFVGISTTDPIQGATVAGVDKFESGNICLFNKKEFLATVTDDVVTWVEIGDDDLRTVVEELQNSKADKVPEGYGKWTIQDYTSTIAVEDGMTVGIKWYDFQRVKACTLYPVIRNTYPLSFESAPYHMRFRYVPANQATSAKNINIILNGLLIIFIDEDTGQRSNHDGVVEIVCSSADDTNTPREFEITRYDYEGQTPVCVVRMRKI